MNLDDTLEECRTYIKAPQPSIFLQWEYSNPCISLGTDKPLTVDSEMNQSL